MEDKKITVDEILQVCNEDMKKLAQEVADSFNNARDGHIINDTEEHVRDATAAFKAKMYERMVEVSQEKRGSFSPEGAKEQG